jgi:hypothetical protein
VRAAIGLVIAGAIVGWTQEASSGFALRTNLTVAGFASSQLAESPRKGSSATPALRALLYPTWKLRSNWTVSGAVQVHTRPYFVEQFSTQGRGVRGDVLQLHLSYARFWKDNSLVVRAGQLAPAFGSFLLRYDDADNPLIDMPLAYGYYYKGVSSYGMAGAQVDLTINKVDARFQLVNSSPANRRSVLDSDQYANWVGGAGYTFFQGLRVGGSVYNGPYLHRAHAYFRPGEASPASLRATAAGVDAQWARGHWTSHAEWQWFRFPYRAMPTFTQQGGYAEARRVLHPRWFAAARAGYLRSGPTRQAQSYEVSAGFRPNRHQLLKVGYQLRRCTAPSAANAGVFAVQLVTTLPTVSIVKD